jgi:hypothetical protein
MMCSVMNSSPFLLRNSCFQQVKRPYRINQFRSLIARSVFFPCQPRVNVLWSSAVRDVTRHITKSAGLFARRTPIRQRIGSKRVSTVRTFPLGHRSHLPTSKVLQYVCFL